MTPRPFRKVIQESKQVKPKADWTYCTDRSGLNLQTGRKTEKLPLARRSEAADWLIKMGPLCGGGAYVLTMACSAIFRSLSTNLSMRYEAMRGALRYSLKKR